MVYTVENVKHLTIWNLFLLSLSEDYGKRSLAFNKQGSEVNDFYLQSHGLKTTSKQAFLESPIPRGCCITFILFIVKIIQLLISFN